MFEVDTSNNKTFFFYDILLTVNDEIRIREELVKVFDIIVTNADCFMLNY